MVLTGLPLADTITVPLVVVQYWLLPAGLDADAEIAVMARVMARASWFLVFILNIPKLYVSQEI